MPTEIIVIAHCHIGLLRIRGRSLLGRLANRERGKEAERSPGNDLPAATSHSALSALRGRDAGQQVERGQSAVRHFCCLRCETTVTFTPPPKGSKPDR